MNEYQPNPYEAPRVAADELVLPTIGADHRRLRSWVIVQSLVIVGGLVAQYFSIETIIVTGLVFGLLGFCIAVLAIRTSRLGVLFGVSSVVFTIFIFSLINLAEWGPRDARQPVIAMSWGYALVITPLVRALLVTKPSG